MLMHSFKFRKLSVLLSKVSSLCSGACSALLLSSRGFAQHAHVMWGGKGGNYHVVVVFLTIVPGYQFYFLALLIFYFFLVCLHCKYLVNLIFRFQKFIVFSLRYYTGHCKVEKSSEFFGGMF